MKVGTGSLFTGSSLIKTFAGMAISLFALNLIGPEKIGLWQAALLIKPYTGFIQFGLTQGLGRELPLFMGKNKHELVRKYISTSQFVTSWYTGIVFIVAIVLTLFVAEGVEEKLIFLTAGVFISTRFVDNYLSSTYRSSRSFFNLSKVYVFTSILGLLLLPLVYFYKFNGYMLLLFIQSIITTLLLIIYRPYKVKSNFDINIYKETVKTGFPILSLNFLRNIPDTYPKILILFFISTTALGLTAPANAALTAFGILPVALAKYIFPTLTYQYGKDGSRYNLWKKIKKISGYLFILGLFGLLSLFIIPYAIEIYFPKYQEAIVITMIAVGIGFMRMYKILFNLFNILKNYKEQFKVSLSRNLLYLLIPSLLFFIKDDGNGLIMIFWGILWAELISTLIMIYYLYKVTHTK